MAALLAQLQHVLQSWDGLATDTPASAGASAAAPSPSPAGDGDPLLLSGGVGGHGSSVVVPVSFFGSHGKDHAANTNNNNITLNGSRQALKQLELARAALALFTSNSGVYRPILQQLLSFVFEYLDFMVEDRSQLVLASGTATTALANLSESASINPADHDVVAAAYQKVRMVEAKMAALVEEASTQRDRYKAQLAILQQQVEKLEGLLVHQIELTHIIQDSHLEDKYGKRRNSDPKRGKDAAYVQRLIARAAREKALEELEEHVGQLTGEQEGLNTKILKLTRLNSRYARQAIEISARLSILRDHNVALASDAQLFQRDALLEQQKGSKLARDLTVLRNMFVTLLETRNREVLLSAAHTPSVRGMAPGRHNRAVLLAVANNSVGEDRLHMNSTRTSSIADMGTSYCEDRASTEPLDDDDAATNTTMMDQSMRSMTTVKALDKVDEAVGNIRDTILRQQLQDILQVNDRSSGGAVKGALLSVLNLKQASRDHFHQTMGGSPPRRGRGGHGRSRVDASRLSELRDHFWSAPYGTGVHIPPHLRSRHCVPLLSLHPLVAECFVHELLTQRQDLMDYAWKESIEVEAMNALSGIGNASSSSNATYIASTTTTTPPSTTANTKTKNNKSKSKAQVVSVAASAAAGVAAPATNSTTSNAPAKRSTKYGAIMPLGEFIELFVNVVWLNREERFAPLLPENVRKTLRHDKFALGGEDGASRASAGLEDGSKESAAVQNAVKWQLHCLIHTIRPPEDMLRLSDEGLRLTYALDAASRRPDAGFLTYAYGLCSRGVLGEMIFEVFRSERKVFMDMCHEVDQERADALAERRAAERAELIARRAQENGSVGGGSGERTPSPPRTTTSNNNNTNAEENERPRGRQRGCIPTVQLARILTTMFPTYPVLKIEQLIIAATEDGTDSSESPVMVYYAVLLPERLLPGSVASSIEGSTFWREGSFAALFFTSICHDALESMQMVEDSVNHFVFTRNTQQRRGGEIGGLVSSTATAKQLSTFALSGIAGGELSHWGPCLRSILYRWNTLRATTAYSSRHRHDDDGGASGGGGGGGGGNASTPAQLLTPKSGASSSSAATTSPTKSAAGKEVVASRIPVMDVMPFLRRFLVLRRGIHTLDSPSSFYDTERTSTAASPTKQQQQQHSHGRQHAVPASGTSSAAEAPAAGSAESSESDDVLPEDSVALSATTSGVVMEPLFSWSGAQAEYIDALQRRWERYSDAAELTMEDDPIIFMARLRKYDPQRLRSWSTPEVAENNPLLRTMDWIYHEEEYHDHHHDDEEEEEEEEDDEYEEEGPYAGEMAAKNATAAAAAANRSNLISGTRRTFMQPTSPGSPPPEVGNSALKQRAAGRMKTVSIVEVSSSSSSRQQRSSRPTTADEVCGERSPEMAPALPLSLPTSDRHDEHHDDDDDMPPMEASMATALPGGLVVGVAPLPSGPYSPDNSRVLGAPTMQQSAASLPDPRSITPPFDGAI